MTPEKTIVTIDIEFYRLGHFSETAEEKTGCIVKKVFGSSF